jgi:mono/diheme cytochrome c family protein
MKPSTLLSGRRAMLLFLSLICFWLYVEAQSAGWTAPPIAQGVKNPLPVTLSAVQSGKAVYTSYCTPCHGPKGKGDGPAAAALNPKPADHTSAKVQTETDGSLFWKISEGRNPMPQYKAVLSETQRWQVIEYIRTLSKK